MYYIVHLYGFEKIMNSNRSPFSLQEAFLDYNGMLVNHIVHHNESYGNESSIASEIESLFRKYKTTDVRYPVTMRAMRYPEEKPLQVISYYKKQWAQVEIRKKDKVDLIPEDNSYVYSYTISFPFRYIIYTYCNMYGSAQKKDISTFQNSTKAELKALFNAHQDKGETYRTDAIRMLNPITWLVIDVGS